MTSYNVFAYCKNNPVTASDPNGLFSFGVVLGAAAGGAIAGALIGGVSYLTSNGISESGFSLGDFLGAVGIGAVNGAAGGVAGTVGNSLKTIISVSVGVISGTYAAANTEGTLGQKMLVGITTGIIAAGSTYIGASIDTGGLSSASTAFANYATTLGVGVPAEILAVATQQCFNNIMPQETTPQRNRPRNYVCCVT